MSLDIQTVRSRKPVSVVLQHWQEVIREAATGRQSVVIAGAGTKSFYGLPMRGEILLDARRHHGIVEYEPTELVITARCGTPLSEIDAALDTHGQMLAFEPPRFGGTPTIGGVIASGLSGPRRMSAGSVRDFVLGAQVLNGNADLLCFGGRVMKNVAGYDVSRLLTGSLGCLGIVTEVSLKVLPKPSMETTLQFELSERAALERLSVWAGQALPVSASLWVDGALCVRLSGADPAVDAACRKLGGQTLDKAHAVRLWASVRDQSHPFFEEGNEALVRLSLPATAEPITISDRQLIEWGGAQRWHRVDVAHLPRIRELASIAGGHATLFRAPRGHVARDVFTPLTKPMMSIHRALKRSFDPAGVFNRGRMYEEL
ncbi:glycolate oxidase subunit GlcE [Trinickia dinghuensis]|uniref:Glycolate oxidase subunit GlcE n=1 Tax=Trinickia dinghuensis TaxID=2291023 RepID=A0A3D8K1Y1_9BURK|nr:glycolate oxidase subunit GlcE [Trinickia dinghuensis]RDU99259.1 glycolate oxidase subunit GlcE [Trinickia dinghuensis]